jgi:hypothetical protein
MADWKLPRLVTGSTWDNVAGSLYDQMKRARPVSHAGAPYGTIAPTLTNREAAALIDSWRHAAGAHFPLWYALAAPAYGWHEQGDPLGVEHGDDYYPADDAAILWPWIIKMAPAMDADKVPQPRLDIDPLTYEDPAFIGTVRAQLEQDGNDLPALEAQMGGTPKRFVDAVVTPPPGAGKVVTDPLGRFIEAVKSIPAPIKLAGLVLIGWYLYTTHDKE